MQAAPLAAAPSSAPRLPSGLIIGSIKVETNNVFETAVPGENKWLYREANHIHIKTRDAVIWRELIFAVGDRYDPALIVEMERNLRALPFIRRAEVSAIVNDKGTVDVIVHTYDSWSLQPSVSFKRAGGVNSEAAEISDTNILGLGKTVSADYSRDGSAESKSFGYQDFQFMNQKHLLYSMLAASAPGIKNCSLSLNRPFYASIAPTAAGGAVTYAENNISTYSGEAAIGSVKKRMSEASIDYGIAIATSTVRTRRVKFGFLAHHADFFAIPDRPAGPMPDREQWGLIQMSADWEQLDFIKVRRIQKFTHDEDYNLGLVVLPGVSWAPAVRAFGTTQTQILPSIIASKGFMGANQFLLLSSSYGSKYVNGRNGNRLASFSGTYYVHGLKNQTLALHSGLDLGWHLDPANPLTLGEANGLRGYGLSAFTGNRRLLFNVEDRIYIRDDLWHLLDVGAVIFFDSGYVWPSSSPIDLVNLKNSVGFGLRVAPSRSAGNSPVRIDMAYALDNNQSRSRWSLSILAGQAFGP